MQNENLNDSDSSVDSVCFGPYTMKEARADILKGFPRKIESRHSCIARYQHFEVPADTQLQDTTRESEGSECHSVSYSDGSEGLSVSYVTAGGEVERPTQLTTSYVTAVSDLQSNSKYLETVDASVKSVSATDVVKVQQLSPMTMSYITAVGDTQSSSQDSAAPNTSIISISSSDGCDPDLEANESYQNLSDCSGASSKEPSIFREFELGLVECLQEEFYSMSHENDYSVEEETPQRETSASNSFDFYHGSVTQASPASDYLVEELPQQQSSTSTKSFEFCQGSVTEEAPASDYLVEKLPQRQSSAKTSSFQFCHDSLIEETPISDYTEDLPQRQSSINTNSFNFYHGSIAEEAPASNHQQDLDSSDDLNNTFDEINRLLGQSGLGASPKPTTLIQLTCDKSKTIRSSAEHPQCKSKIPTHIATPTFKVPSVTKSSKKVLTPSTSANKYKDIVSPVGLYIKHAPKYCQLVKVPERKVSTKLFAHKVPKENIPEDSEGEECLFPPVIYRPARHQVVVEEPSQKLPESIKKLVPTHTVIKHEKRIEGGQHDMSLERRLLESDFSINESQFDQDVSIVTKKTPF